MQLKIKIQTNPCGICGGQSDNSTGFPTNNSGFYSSTTPPILRTQSDVIWS